MFGVCCWDQEKLENNVAQNVTIFSVIVVRILLQAVAHYASKSEDLLKRAEFIASLALFS